MANTYTTKLGLAKPANGDVDWHIPINKNWDDIDSKLGPLYEDFVDSATEIKVNKNINMNQKNIVDIESLVFKRTTHVLGNDGLLFSGSKATIVADYAAPGEALIKVIVAQYDTGHYNPPSPRTITVLKNGVSIGTLTQSGIYGSSDDGFSSYYPAAEFTFSASYSLAAGDVFTVTINVGTTPTLEFYGTIGFALPTGLIV